MGERSSLGRTDVLYIAELPPGADFSVLGAHLIPDHVSRFDPKVRHFSRYSHPVWETYSMGVEVARGPEGAN